MNRKLWLLIVLMFTLAPVVASAQPPAQTTGPLPTPTLPPWCEDTGGEQPCLPWRPTPVPVTTEVPPLSTRVHRVYLPVVLGD